LEAPNLIKNSVIKILLGGFDMGFYSFKNIPKEEVSPGASRRIISGDKIMLVLWELKPGAEVPLHSHPHEQVTYVLQGKAEVTVGDEKMIVGPGDVYHVPFQSNLKHEVKVLGEETFIELDIFHPIREDFLKK